MDRHSTTSGLPISLTPQPDPCTNVSFADRLEESLQVRSKSTVRYQSHLGLTLSGFLCSSVLRPARADAAHAGRAARLLVSAAAISLISDCDAGLDDSITLCLDERAQPRRFDQGSQSMNGIVRLSGNWTLACCVAQCWFPKDGRVARPTADE